MTALEARIDKLLCCIRALMDRHGTYKRNSAVHTAIDRYYYIEKTESLQLLKDLLVQARMKESEVLKQYESVYKQWRKDVRWLNDYMRSKSS